MYVLNYAAKRSGVVIKPTFVTEPSLSYDIHVDPAVAVLS